MNDTTMSSLTVGNSDFLETLTIRVKGVSFGPAWFYLKMLAVRCSLYKLCLLFMKDTDKFSPKQTHLVMFMKRQAGEENFFDCHFCVYAKNM